jgi:HEPN domain-containing protein
MSNPAPVAEWVRVAEADYEAALALAKPRKNFLYQSVCFHCQQCAEKYLKAFLQKHGTEPPRIHSLLNLNKACTKIDGSFLLIGDLVERLAQRLRNQRQNQGITSVF